MTIISSIIKAALTRIIGLSSRGMVNPTDMGSGWAWWALYTSYLYVYIVKVYHVSPDGSLYKRSYIRQTSTYNCTRLQSASLNRSSGIPSKVGNR